MDAWGPYMVQLDVEPNASKGQAARIGMKLDALNALEFMPSKSTVVKEKTP
jgi:hypothetical protein